jgi:hypothetical protein
MKNHTKSDSWRLFFLITLLGIFSVGLLSHQSRLIEDPNLLIQDGEFSASDMTQTGTISGNTFSNQEVTYSVVDGVSMVEGDIILRLDGEGMQTAGTGVPFIDRRWENGLVPYAIDSALPDQLRIHDSIAHWEGTTGIRFVLRDDNNANQYPDYVYFRPSTGCSSYVGRMGGMQPINLAQGCTTGSTIHEIGHAVGLWHEQSRIDRDDYVTIHYENIIPETIFNFNQHISDGIDIDFYDFDSIMHYPRWAFSKNGKDTIVPKQDVEIGQRQILSQGDIDAVAYMYQDILQPASGE